LTPISHPFRKAFEDTILHKPFSFSILTQ